MIISDRGLPRQPVPGRGGARADRGAGLASARPRAGEAIDENPTDVSAGLFLRSTLTTRQPDEIVDVFSQPFFTEFRPAGLLHC